MWVQRARGEGWGRWCPPGGVGARWQAPTAGDWPKARENTEALNDSTDILLAGSLWFRLATVMEDVASLPGQLDSAAPPRLLDRQGWSTLVAGALLLLISLTTNDGNDNLLKFGDIATLDKVGMGLHLAALAALAGDVQLASRLRHRDAYEAARAREQATRRARIQNGCLVAQYRFLLADTARNRLQLSEALAVLLEAIKSPNA